MLLSDSRLFIKISCLIRWSLLCRVNLSLDLRLFRLRLRLTLRSKRLVRLSILNSLIRILELLVKVACIIFVLFRLRHLAGDNSSRLSLQKLLSLVLIVNPIHL